MAVVCIVLLWQALRLALQVLTDNHNPPFPSPERSQSGGSGLPDNFGF